MPAVPDEERLSPEHVAILQKMTFQQKLEAAAQLRAAAWAVVRAGMKRRHPQADDAALDQMVREAFLYARD